MARFIHICTMCGRDFENDKRKSYVCNVCDSKAILIKKLKMIDKAEYKLTHVGGRQRMKFKISIENEISFVRNRIVSGIDSFSSIPEVMVAIQLKYRDVEYISQKKVGSNVVDFFLPKMKIVLEIDGDLYHSDDEKEFARDRAIMKNLGEDYEIVHIGADLVPRHTWNLDIVLPMIIDARNEDSRFRDSRTDSIYLERFSYIRGGRNGYYKKNT